MEYIKPYAIHTYTSCIYIYIYTYIHTYIPTYIYIYMYSTQNLGVDDRYIDVHAVHSPCSGGGSHGSHQSRVYSDEDEENEGGPSTQWEFQDPKMEVLYHTRPYLVGIFSCIARTLALWVLFNLVKWPLISRSGDELGPSKYGYNGRTWQNPLVNLVNIQKTCVK